MEANFYFHKEKFSESIGERFEYGFLQNVTTDLCRFWDTAGYHQIRNMKWDTMGCLFFFESIYMIFVTFIGMKSKIYLGVDTFG